MAFYQQPQNPYGTPSLVIEPTQSYLYHLRSMAHRKDILIKSGFILNPLSERDIDDKKRCRRCNLRCEYSSISFSSLQDPTSLLTVAIMILTSRQAPITGTNSNRMGMGHKPMQSPHPSSPRPRRSPDLRPWPTRSPKAQRGTRSPQSRSSSVSTTPAALLIWYPYPPPHFCSLCRT